MGKKYLRKYVYYKCSLLDRGCEMDYNKSFKCSQSEHLKLLKGLKKLFG